MPLLRYLLSVRIESQATDADNIMILIILTDENSPRNFLPLWCRSVVNVLFTVQHQNKTQFYIIF